MSLRQYPSVLAAIFLGEPGLSGFIEANDDGSGEWWQLEKMC